MQATLKQKLDIGVEPYVILGACNPPLAHAALEAEPELGVLLPCNVVVYPRKGETHISAVDAEQMRSIVGNDQLAAVAEDVRARLGNVVAASSPTSTSKPIDSRQETEMTRNKGNIDRLARGVVAIITLILEFAVGIGSVVGVVLVLVGVVMAITAAVGFCPLYRLIGLSTERHTVAPR